MKESIELDDGRVLRVLGRPAQGTRHQVLVCALASGARVVVKMERIEGALKTELEALAWLTALSGPAPRLRTAAYATFADERAFCVVTDVAPGRIPTSLAAWRRMGRTLATLADIDWDGSGLPVYEAVTFGQKHSLRIRELAGDLYALREAVPDWEQLSSAEIPTSSDRLVLTHGDPGPGNYLDGGGTGTLIDWEEAHVAPRGLDLARCVFIALLGAGPVGYVARDQEQRARAVMSGYLDELAGSWRPAREELRWWLTAAGVQFIHRRWERAGQPGVGAWQEAADVMCVALATLPWCRL
jgi:aminoglycoside phosphotransferase (APT) family kinase protein